MKKTILILALLPLLFACSKEAYDWTNKIDKLQKHNKSKVSITEGIWGTLTQREGDWMPGSDGNRKEFPTQREIAVYEYTTIKEIEGHPSSCEVHTKLIATTTCDKEGFFELNLNPGKYSVFLKEKGKLYAISGDGAGGLCPVEVESSKVSELNLSVSYATH